MKSKYASLLLLIVFFSCKKELAGSGIIITQVRPVENFNAVVVGGDFDVTIYKAPGYSLSLTGEDNVLEKVQTYVDNGRLTIRYGNEIDTHKHQRVIVKVSSAEINSMRLDGSGNIQAVDTWIEPAFTVEINGSGNINAHARAEKAYVTINGSGKVNISGSASNADLNISGSGAIGGFALASSVANTSVQGSGKIETMVTSKLKASINGSGKVYYKGSPDITSDIKGSGTLNNAN